MEEQERVSGSNTPPNMGSLRTGSSDDAINNASASASDSGLTTNSHVRSVSEIEEVTERVTTSEQLAS